MGEWCKNILFLAKNNSFPILLHWLREHAQLYESYIIFVSNSRIDIAWGMVRNFFLYHLQKYKSGLITFYYGSNWSAVYFFQWIRHLVDLLSIVIRSRAFFKASPFSRYTDKIFCVTRF